MANSQLLIQMKRIFIAHKVNPGENLIGMFNCLKSELTGEKIKWTALENIHVTLLFIGDTEEQNLKRIESVLKDTCCGTDGYDLVLRGIGVFRNLADPRIIWTGLDKCEKLLQLNKLIFNRLSDVVLNLRDRPFNPHITLGRIKYVADKAKLEQLTDKYQNIEIQRISVNEVVLYESILKPEGPVYKPIEIYSL
jgi:2'-5' RNA ligase